MTRTQEQELIEREAMKLPQTFELQAFPGEQFSIIRCDSYVSDGKAVLYVGILRDGKYQAFSKGSVMEIAAQIYYPTVHGRREVPSVEPIATVAANDKPDKEGK